MNPNQSCSTDSILNQKESINSRDGSAALVKEDCLCTPVNFDPKYLEVMPQEVIEKDYGCGDPTQWVKKGDAVLDLGSGSGKNAFICSQVVGKAGKVIGIDQNREMLSLANKTAPIVASKIGFENVTFIKAAIESIDNINDDGYQIIASSSIDIVLSNCVLNLVSYSDRNRLLKNIKRILKPRGRIAISDIVSNKKVPIELQRDSNLWSGCISGAWQEEQFIDDFKSLGFTNVKFAKRQIKPWKVIQNIEFRSVTLTGFLN